MVLQETLRLDIFHLDRGLGPRRREVGAALCGAE
jgi:hypothetical protein